MQQGAIKLFLHEKGYGFIRPDDGGRDVFVHISNVQAGARRLIEGDAVAYEIGPDPRSGRPIAINVRAI